VITKTLPPFFRVKVFAIMEIKSLFKYEADSGPDRGARRTRALTVPTG
jgi:hypothetical protein